MSDYFTKHPSLWLTLYGSGSVLTTAAVAGWLGGMAAGTVAGILAVAGTVGYEILTRRKLGEKLDGNILSLNIGQDRLTREVSKTRNDVDLLKDDLARAALSLQQQAKKLDERLNPTVAVRQPAMKKVQESFSRMGNRPRGGAGVGAVTWPTPRKAPSNNLQMMATQYMHANNDDGDFDTTAPAPQFSKAVISELLHHAVQHDRIEIFAQPIVRLPSRKIVHLELFARIRARAGVYLTADQYRGIAEQETLLSQVDHLLLTHAIEGIRSDARRGFEISYFLNISGRTLRDVAFMSDLLEFVKSNRNLAQFMIFELQQKEFDTLDEKLVSVMRGLAQIGCGFSLDHVTEPQVDAAKLSDLNVRFIKIDGKKLAMLGETAEGVALVERIKTRLDHVGITMIAERLESEHDLKELLDFEIDLGEGHLFGKPDLEIAYRPKKIA